MDKSHQNIWLAALVLLVLLLAYWAWDKCHLGKYSKKGCPSNKGGFCGAAPDPGAMSEAWGLYELGVRPSEGFCGSTPAPAALAEYQGLMQMGWRPEHLRVRPTCAPAHPAAISEAQSLQHAQALSPGAPYYHESFAGQPSGCGAVSSEATGEARLLNSLQALPEMDSFASQKVMRDQAAIASTRDRQSMLRENPAQISARKARFSSMREGFGGPDAAGYGWTPNAADIAASPATGGWGDSQSIHAAKCMDQCMDGCGGTNCREHCSDQCSTIGLEEATGVY